MIEILCFVLILFVFPNYAYAHGGHAPAIMRFKQWLHLMWFQYWGGLTWVLALLLVGLVIFFIVQQTKANRSSKETT